MFQHPTQFLLCQLCRTCSCQYNYIEAGQLQLTLTEGLTAHALDAIAPHGGLDLFLGDGQTQAGMGQVVLPAQQGKVFVADLAGLRKDLFKLGRPEKSLVPSKSPGKHGRCYAESTLRPRARRALRILRPAAVAIRARNPWRRARFKLLG